MTLKLRNSVLLLPFVIVGCSVGNAPQTMTETDVQQAVKKLSPQEQIDYINRSPLPAAEKQKRIAEIEAQSGTKAETKSGPPPSL